MIPPPPLTEQLEELRICVMDEERKARTRGGWARPAQHFCELPQAGDPWFGMTWACGCGQVWKRELGGGWITA